MVVALAAAIGASCGGNTDGSVPTVGSTSPRDAATSEEASPRSARPQDPTPASAKSPAPVPTVGSTSPRDAATSEEASPRSARPQDPTPASAKSPAPDLLETCPVTIPAEPAFRPPDPYPTSPSVGPEFIWYGDERLWTVLEIDGIHDVKRKSVWWSTDFEGGAQEARPKIAVSWQRLDSDARPIRAGPPGTNAFTAEDGVFMIAGIEPTDSGCWEATATYRNATLSYVYLVP